MTDTIDAIGIAVPRQWVELPVDQERFDRMRGRLRDQWADASAWDRSQLRYAELLLVRLRRDLLRGRPQFAAMYLSPPLVDDASEPPVPASSSAVAADEPSSTSTTASAAASPSEETSPPDGSTDTGDAAEDDRQMLTASVVVGTYTRDDFGTDGDLSLGTIAMAFAEGTSTSASAAAQGGMRVTNVEPPALHGLPLGPSVRLRRLYEVVGPALRNDRFFGETYFTPVATDGSRCVVTHFVTPNLGLTTEFSTLFEQIAETVTGFAPDHPVDFDSAWVETGASSGTSGTSDRAVDQTGTPDSEASASSDDEAPATAEAMPALDPVDPELQRDLQREVEFDDDLPSADELLAAAPKPFDGQAPDEHADASTPEAPPADPASGER